ncbi:MAG TPA: CHAT domain-containing protein [Pirellulales bacterium]
MAQGIYAARDAGRSRIFAGLRGTRWLAPRSIFAALVWLCAAGGASAQFFTSDSIPHTEYFSTLSTFMDGDYREALREFQTQTRIKGPNNTLWIDSICIDVMIGECYYQMGEHNLALKAYEAALNMYAAYPDWMLRVEFTPGIPVATNQIKMAPWGRTARSVRYGQYKETYSINQGRIDNTQVIVGGGVVQQAIKLPVHAQEIVRCTALAMRRRREIMGPSCAPATMTGNMVSLLARRPGPPNHWSEAWIDIQLGVAYLAAGKDAEARTTLQRAVLAAGEFDHPFTGMALLELGRMSMADGDYTAATNFFSEASFAAAAYLDIQTVEEALRYGQITHLIANRPGLYPALAPAAAWAKANDQRLLQVSMLTLAAENSCCIGQAPAAVAFLNTARVSMGRRAMQTGKAGARVAFISALAAYQQGNVTLGDQQLALAMTFQKTGSLWLYQMTLADYLFTHGVYSARTAMDLYTATLRDPTATDWLMDPLESLSLMYFPHDDVYDRWFEVAVERKDHDRVLEISDLARRHRFLSTLDLGGRVHNLRWLLEQPEENLDAKIKLERQEILTRYPQYGELQKQARKLREEIKKDPLVAKDQHGAKQLQERLGKMSELGASAEVILREIAVRRDPAALVFPPCRTAKDLRAALPPGQAILSFFNTSKRSYAVLLTHDKYGYWQTPGDDALSKPMIKLLQSLGNLETNREVTTADLAGVGWREQSKQMLETLTTKSKADLTSFKELVIVPDGVLWYLPFEALTVRDGDQLVPLMSKVKIRYAPLASLGVPDTLPRLQEGVTGVVIGKLMQSGDESLAKAAFESISQSLPGAVALHAPLPMDTAAFTSLFDGMIVLNDTPAVDQTAYQLSLLPTNDRGTGSSLANLFSLPWGGPDVVVMPSFHTAAERSLKKASGHDPGHEVFLNVCGLMANGARTILLSRWRTGGQSSVDLVREFVQELPHATATDAWQRAVVLVGETQLDPSSEPRLKLTARDEAPKADHPFFWAGYMLVDTGALPQELADQQKKNPAEAAAPPVAAVKPPAGAPAQDPAPKAVNPVKPKAAPSEATEELRDIGETSEEPTDAKKRPPAKGRKPSKTKPAEVEKEKPAAADKP